MARTVVPLVLCGALIASAAVAVASVPAGAAVRRAAAGTKPVVTALQPNYGSTVGSSNVVVDGRRFTEASKVYFGGEPARDVRFISSHVLEAYTPSSAHGVRSVVVKTASGSSASSRASRYTYTHVALPGSWTDRQGPTVAGPKLQGTGNTSCPVAGTCYSVGDAGDRATIQTRTGNSEQAAFAPLPAGDGSDSTESQLDDITCPAVGSCSAIGDFDVSRKAMLLHLSDGAWTATQAMLPSGLASGRIDLNGLSCGGPDDCVAVGNVESVDAESDAPGLIYTLHDGTWTVQRAPTPATANVASVEMVSCPSVTWCLASGYYSVSRVTNDLLTYSDGTWTARDEPTAPVGHALGVRALECPAVQQCTLRVGVPDEFLTLRATTYAFHRIALPGDARGSYLLGGDDAMSCPTVSVCYAIDYFREGGDSHDARYDTVVIRLNGDRVRVYTMPETLAASGGNDYLRRTFLNDIACSSGGSCVAVGSVGRARHELVGVYDTFTGGVWSPGVYSTPSGSPDGTDLDIRSVSCPSDGACFAVGTVRHFDPVQDDADYAAPVSVIQTPAH